MLVLDLVTNALRDIAVIGETDSPTAEQGEDAVTRLNEIMASLEESGISLGYNPKADTADTIVLPPGHVLTIRALLAISLCDVYPRAVPAFIAAMADSGYKRLLRQAIYKNIRETRTDNAPRGDAQCSTHNILTDG
jgi:hypothetical protein